MNFRRLFGGNPVPNPQPPNPASADALRSAALAAELRNVRRGSRRAEPAKGRQNTAAWEPVLLSRGTALGAIVDCAPFGPKCVQTLSSFRTPRSPPPAARGVPADWPALELPAAGSGRCSA